MVVPLTMRAVEDAILVHLGMPLCATAEPVIRTGFGWAQPCNLVTTGAPVGHVHACIVV